MGLKASIRALRLVYGPRGGGGEYGEEGREGEISSE